MLEIRTEKIFNYQMRFNWSAQKERKHVSLKFSFTLSQETPIQVSCEVSVKIYVTIPVEILCYWKHDSLVEVYFHEISLETPIQVSCEVSLRL